MARVVALRVAEFRVSHLKCSFCAHKPFGFIAPATVESNTAASAAHVDRVIHAAKNRGWRCDPVVEKLWPRSARQRVKVARSIAAADCARRLRARARARAAQPSKQTRNVTARRQTVAACHPPTRFSRLCAIGDTLVDGDHRRDRRPRREAHVKKFSAS